MAMAMETPCPPVHGSITFCWGEVAIGECFGKSAGLVIFWDKKHGVFCKASPVLEVLLHHITEGRLVEGVKAFQVHAHPFIVRTEAARSRDRAGCADGTARLRLTAAAAGLGGIGDTPFSYHGEADVVAIEGRNLHTVKLLQLIFIHALLQDGPANNKAEL